MEDEIDLLKYLPERYRNAVERIFIANWAELAAECYANYLEEGRGLMGLFIASGDLNPMYLSWPWLQTNWDELLGDADPSIQNSIKRLAPCYNPYNECVFLFEFPEDDQVQSAVMQVTGSVLLIVGQNPGVAVPRLRRFEFVTPKNAYRNLAVPVGASGGALIPML